MPPVNLPPGKSGLQVQTLNIEGIVGGPSGMIAVVANPQQRVYFLREGDQLFDGQRGTHHDFRCDLPRNRQRRLRQALGTRSD